MEEKKKLLVDTKGLCCPLPILKAKKAIDTLDIGEVLEVVATDPGSKADFKAWSRATGHELLEATETEGTYTYLIRRSK